MGARFSAPVQTGPGAHPATCTMGTGSFPWVKYGRCRLLTTHHLVSRSWNVRAISLPTLWATTGPVMGKLLPYRASYIKDNSSHINSLGQECTNLGYQVALGAKYFKASPNIHGSSVWNLLPLTFLALSEVAPRFMESYCTPALGYCVPRLKYTTFTASNNSKNLATFLSRGTWTDGLWFNL